MPQSSESARDAERILAALDPEQRSAAEVLHGPVRILAGAGTGKTRAITHRIAYAIATGAVAPTEALALTFTQRAAGEMRQRLRALGVGAVQARTFHSAALRQLRYFWPHTYRTQLPQIIESKAALLQAAATRADLHLPVATLRDVASEIEWAKVSNVRPDDYAVLAAARHREVTDLDPIAVARLMRTYEEVKRDKGRIDMEDVLLLTAGMLAENDSVAREVRRQYTWFTVDEYQDVSPIQSALLDLWLGGRTDLCVVGDPAQTIYSFAGADARFLRDFARTHPGTTTVELTRNYRSTPQVVAASNALLAGTPSEGVRLRAVRPDGPAVGVGAQRDEVAEAEFVAQRMHELHRAGLGWAEMAVLVRTNAMTEPFEEALAGHEIPYVVRGGLRFFDRPEVKEGITRIRGQARGVTPNARGAELVDAVRAILAGIGWTERPPGARGAARDRWESWQGLVNLALDFGGTLGEFVDDLDRRAEEQHAPVADAVTVASLHAAKGLEWDAVFLVGLHEGALPISYAFGDEVAIEEERRLFHVGITRARLHLSLSYSLARAPGAQARREASRFLDALLP